VALFEGVEDLDRMPVSEFMDLMLKR
jgi:hypothetical protein